MKSLKRSRCVYTNDYIGVNDEKDFSIFLAGPTPRSADVKSWRPELIEYMNEYLVFPVTFFVPEYETYDPNREWDYLATVEWEEYYLEKSSVILFWVPRDMKTMPALTTNVEFGMWVIKDAHKIIFGYPEDAVHNRYLAHYAKKNNILVRDSFPGLLNAIVKHHEFWEGGDE